MSSVGTDMRICCEKEQSKKGLLRTVRSLSSECGYIGLSKKKGDYFGNFGHGASTRNDVQMINYTLPLLGEMAIYG